MRCSATLIIIQHQNGVLTNCYAKIFRVTFNLGSASDFFMLAEFARCVAIWTASKIFPIAGGASTFSSSFSGITIRNYTKSITKVNDGLC